MKSQPLNLDLSVAVVVIGGCNIDRKCQTLSPMIMGTSNPGTERSSVGGVGRNVAENLARLGVSTALITAVGADSEGMRIRSETETAGVHLGHSLETSSPTGSYTVVLNNSGEMVIAVASMAGVDELSPDVVDGARDLIEHARMLILDCNVPESTLLHAARLAGARGVPVIIDPVSARKAMRVSGLLSAGIRLHTITPDLGELLALSGQDSVTGAGVDTAIATLHSLGVENVWARLGAAGSIFSAAGGETSTRIPPLAATLVDATGAGDAMLAGYVAALLDGLGPLDAARHGAAAAAITIESELTVSHSMSAAAVAARAERGKFEP